MFSLPIINMLSEDGGQVGRGNYKRSINNHPFLFLLAGLSLSAQFISPFNPANMPDISYYANPEGQLVPIISGSLPQPVYNDEFIFGVNIHGRLYPLFDNRRRWILVEYHAGEDVIVSPELYHTYGHRYAADIISQLENHNDVEFVMPIRSRNRSPNLPANRRREHN